MRSALIGVLAKLCAHSG